MKQDISHLHDSALFRIPLNDQQCMTRPTRINLNPYEHNQGLCHYPFIISLDRYNGICNDINELLSIICGLNKTEHVNLSVFSMITGINESTLTKHISCSYICDAFCDLVSVTIWHLHRHSNACKCMLMLFCTSMLFLLVCMS